MSTEVFRFWASIVCLRFLAEQFQQAGKGSVKVERSEPKGNLDGFLAPLNDSNKNEGTTTRLLGDAPSWKCFF